MSFKQLSIGFLLQITGVKKLWHFKLLFKHFPESAATNTNHDYFGTKYQVQWYDAWLMCIKLIDKPNDENWVYWNISEWGQLPKWEKNHRKEEVELQAFLK